MLVKLQNDPFPFTYLTLGKQLKHQRRDSASSTIALVLILAEFGRYIFAEGGKCKKISKYKKIFADGGGEVANAQRQSAMKDMTALLCDDISRITLSCNCDLNYIQDLLCNDTITIQL